MSASLSWLSSRATNDPYEHVCGIGITYLQRSPEDYHFCKLFSYSLAGEAASNLSIEMKSMMEYMVEDDEQYGSGERSRVEEADTRDPASQSIDITTSPLIDTSISRSIDTDSSCRSTPPEIPEKSSCPQDIPDSKVKSSDVSSNYLALEVDKEIAMEDFLELENFVKLEDEEQPENLGQDLEMKLDKLTLGRDLGTSLKAGIDRESPYIIDLHPPYIIDRHATYIIDLYLPNCIDQHPSPPICAEEAAGFHKRVKRIHDPMKFVVPCIVFEGDFPIPPDKSVHLGSYNGVFDDHMYAVASQRGLRFRGDFGKGPTEAVPNDINKPASIDTTSSSSSIDSHRVSEQIEFKVYQKLFDGGTTTRSDKSGGKMRKN
ncbi:hypothetical protein F2Q70_00003705 [Brassica cretica]|uniref:Uncharacterized protein n=1 Tax=Brassica cretica TaxID=69181 RepID=A0A8S9IX86_BRACR|nr:hypothetical protein F2Q70_00003705 [Brassica cretica]